MSGGWPGASACHMTQKPVPSIGLETLQGYSPLDMAAAYATFCLGGVCAPPDRDPGRWSSRTAASTRPRAGASSRRAACSRRAWPGRSMGCLDRTPLYGTRSGSGDGVHPNAGKTGTTTDHADAWFDGYQRDLSTVVWMGYPQGGDPDAQRARPGGRRRDLPGADVAPLYGRGQKGRAGHGSSSHPTPTAIEDSHLFTGSVHVLFPFNVWIFATVNHDHQGTRNPCWLSNVVYEYRARKATRDGKRRANAVEREAHDHERSVRDDPGPSRHAPALAQKRERSGWLQTRPAGRLRESDVLRWIDEQAQRWNDSARRGTPPPTGASRITHRNTIASPAARGPPALRSPTEGRQRRFAWMDSGDHVAVQELFDSDDVIRAAEHSIVFIRAGLRAFHQWLLREKFRRSVAAVDVELKEYRSCRFVVGLALTQSFLLTRAPMFSVQTSSAGAVTRAAARSSRFAIDFEVAVADAEALPFKNDSFDFVYVHDGLHHLERPLSGVAEMARVARRGVCITEPAQAAITRLSVRLGVSTTRRKLATQSNGSTCDRCAKF